MVKKIVLIFVCVPGFCDGYSQTQEFQRTYSTAGSYNSVIQSASGENYYFAGRQGYSSGPTPALPGGEGELRNDGCFVSCKRDACGEGG